MKNNEQKLQIGMDLKDQSADILDVQWGLVTMQVPPLGQEECNPGNVAWINCTRGCNIIVKLEEVPKLAGGTGDFCTLQLFHTLERILNSRRKIVRIVQQIVLTSNKDGGQPVLLSYRVIRNRRQTAVVISKSLATD
ncbi:hypothetical protein CEXT_279111 [Caerostris extrusa]|uniref:Uncharacterized protein n=1 Tax=Caerostris extrusa TaxID=172846 RepID=A0AAV4Y9C9_CAEEX|nr:hypothetical protein CEXT_279111 [Caerostris extrusa]